MPEKSSWQLIRSVSIMAESERMYCFADFDYKLRINILFIVRIFNKKGKINFYIISHKCPVSHKLPRRRREATTNAGLENATLPDDAQRFWKKMTKACDLLTSLGY